MNHSGQRKKKATIAQLGGILGTIAGAVAGGSIGDLFAQNSMGLAQRYVLKYSRSQETQSDNIGINYLVKAGYDPTAMASMLTALAAQESLEARMMGQDQRTLPSWTSTHPDPALRVQNALNVARATGATGARNEAQFLAQIDGMMYDDDPKDGVIEGSQFLHRDLRFTFNAPAGFGMQNGATAVEIAGSSGQAQFGSLTLQGYRFNGDLDAYIRTTIQALAGENAQIPAYQTYRTTVNYLPAAYTTIAVGGGQGQQASEITIFAYDFGGGQAYHFITQTAQGQTGIFAPMFRSLRRLTDSEAASIRSRRIDVIQARSGDTVQSLARRMAYPTLQLERFMLLNRLQANEAIRPGQPIKLVVYN